MATRVPLKDLCELITKGTTPTSIGFDFADEGVGFLRVQNISGGVVNFEKDTLFIDGQVHQLLKRSQILPGDVLLSIAGSIGRTGVVPENAPPLNCNQAVAILRTSEKIYRPFLRHWLEGEDAQKQMRGATVTGTIQNLSLTQIGELKIPLLSLSEQRRIAAILDQADALRAKRREALALLDELQRGIFIEMFGDPATNTKKWPVRAVGDLLASASYGTSEKSSADGKFPVLRMNNITRSGEMDFVDLKYMDLDESQHERYLVRQGDVLFNRTNSADLVGKTAIYRRSEPMAYAGYLIRLRINAANDPEYLAGFMNTSYAKRTLRSMCKSIIGMANINATEVQAMKIPQPPLELQSQYAKHVETVIANKVVHRRALEEFGALFAALQSRAFRGEL
ncbi:restriction endonuclease subunit S [Accumulibacter sp.]|uniref:restriction endonuclease subunit S n=1 Tax=Accumulibacter sp. TaxID=2053492 RepID=UPI001AD21B1D|nr:restriction endonuclease subunit S [Accumulibacter sp.]MBN8498505.1 restriction endonuclease subunit S [Accumulibacter sp.]